MKYFKIISILFSIAFIFSSNPSDAKLKLNSISFNVDQLVLDLGNPDPDMIRSFLSIGRMKFDFSDIDVMFKNNPYYDRIQYSFSGPNFTMDNFDLNLVFETPYHSPWQELKSEFENRFNLNNTLEIKEFILTLYYQHYNQSRYYDYSNEDLNDIEFSIPESMKNQWRIEVIDNEIVATSLWGFKDGPGKVLRFNMYSQNFEGYGESNTSYRKRGEGTSNLKFHLGRVELLFASNGSYETNRHNDLVEFETDKAFFRVSNAQIDFLHNNNPLTKFVLDLGSYHIDLKNIHFEFDDSNEVPKINKSSGEIALNNLGIHIPDEIYRESKFQDLWTLLGMYNNVFSIRQIAMKWQFVKNDNYNLTATIYSSLGMLTMNGDFLIVQTGRDEPEMYINTFTIKVDNLSPGINSIITEWEKKNNQHLPRKSGSIFIELSGTPDDLRIKGLNINELEDLFNR